jgi:flagellar biosynthetic protein FliR
MQLTIPQGFVEQIMGFVLVLARVGPLFLMAPGFSARAVPARAKLVVALALTLAIAPGAAAGVSLPADPLALALLGVKEALVGLGFAFALSALVAGIQLGAGIADMIVGFSFAQIVDPFTQVNSAVLGQVYALFAAIVLMVTGGDQLMVAGLARTYDVVSLTAEPSYDAFGALALGTFADVFLIALQVGAPLIVALVVVDAAFAIVARAAPQMNVFIVGLPGKILVALAVSAASLPFLAGEIRSELERSVLEALTALGVS